MIRRLNVLLIALAAVFAAGLHDLALACDCIRYASAAEQLSRSEAVFRGRVVRSERTGDRRVTTTFAVVEPLKGGLGATVRVQHNPDNGGNCGVTFERGKVVEVAANRMRDGRWRTDACSMPQFDWAAFRRAAGKD